MTEHFLAATKQSYFY